MSVKLSFYITYAFLLTTATITFIEAMRTKIPMIRHILNLETTISVVAAFFYTQFMEKINKPNVDYKDINLNRYADWAITTPIMLLVLCMALGYNVKKITKFSTYFIVLILNYGMLGSGYMGEISKVNKATSTMVGFGFFGLFVFGLLISSRMVSSMLVFKLIFFLVFGTRFSPNDSRSFG